MTPDPHQILGVPRGASEDVVQAAFRKLAMQHHPDRNGGDKSAEERFKAINAAYEAIKSGKAEQSPPRHGAHADADAPWRRKTPYGTRAETVEEMLRAFRAHAHQRNRDIEMTYTVTLEDAFHGRDVNVTLRSPTETRDVPVRLPAGLEHGLRVRIPGCGERVWPNVAPGDLILTFHIAPHGRFGRDNADLHLELPVPVFDALLGTEMEIDTIDGSRLKLTVPSCAKHGMKMRMTGHGMPSMRHQGRRGDLIVTVVLRMPECLTSEQRDAIRAFRSSVD